MGNMFYTSSNLLQYNDIVHGFFGRKGGVSTGPFSSLNCSMKPGENENNVIANRTIACDKLGLELSQLNMVKQVHSNRVHICNCQTTGIEADALVTNLSEIALGIQTADCTPILLFDYENKVIGAVHAGWRGALAGIIGNTVDAMTDLGAIPETMIAAIGPTIQQDAYETDELFKEEFISQNKENVRFFTDGKVNGKYMFNLPEYCISALREKGIVNIDDLQINTYTNTENFFSYRQACHEGVNMCGGQISIICIK